METGEIKISDLAVLVDVLAQATPEMIAQLDREIALYERRLTHMREMRRMLGRQEAASAISSTETRLPDKSLVDRILETMNGEWLTATEIAEQVDDEKRRVTYQLDKRSELFEKRQTGRTAQGGKTVVEYRKKREDVKRLFIERSWLTPNVLAIAQRCHEERGKKCHRCDGSGEVMTSDSHGYMEYPTTCPGCRGTGHISDGTMDPERLSILADALEDAGCDNQDILQHLRGWDRCPLCIGDGLFHDPITRGLWSDKHPCQQCKGRCWIPLCGPRVRGCWALDLILGKE